LYQIVGGVGSYKFKIRKWIFCMNIFKYNVEIFMFREIYMRFFIIDTISCYIVLFFLNLFIFTFRGPSWSWSYPVFGEVYSIPQYVIKFVSDLRQVGGFLDPCTPVSSTNKTDRHDITEILLKVALNTIIPPFNSMCCTCIICSSSTSFKYHHFLWLHNIYHVKLQFILS
jgi:hypothetical protein